jgi:hypothetical protein
VTNTSQSQTEGQPAAREGEGHTELKLVQVMKFLPKVPFFIPNLPTIYMFEMQKPMSIREATNPVGRRALPSLENKLIKPCRTCRPPDLINLNPSDLICPLILAQAKGALALVI